MRRKPLQVTLEVRGDEPAGDAPRLTIGESFP